MDIILFFAYIPYALGVFFIAARVVYVIGASLNDTTVTAGIWLGGCGGILTAGVGSSAAWIGAPFFFKDWLGLYLYPPIVTSLYAAFGMGIGGALGWGLSWLGRATLGQDPGADSQNDFDGLA